MTAELRALHLVQHLRRSLAAGQASEGHASAASSGLSLRDLFNYKRVRDDRISRVWIVLFVLYSPIGVVLMVVRMVLFASVFLTVPFLPGALCRALTPQLLRGILGVVLRVKNVERLDKSCPVLVVNHIHDYDTYLLPMLVPDTRPVISDHTTKIPILGPILKRGYSAWAPLWVPPRQEKVDARDDLRKNVMQHFGKFNRPLGILPEGGLTNGERGLMLFKRFVFTLGLPVQPIAERYVNVWPVHHDYLGSTWLKNMMWAMFLPFHIFELDVLPVHRPQPGENADAYAKRVQHAMADALGLTPTSFPYEAKNRLRKEICGW